MEKAISQQSPQKNVCFSAYSSLAKGTFLTSVYLSLKIDGLFCFFSFSSLHAKIKFYTNYANSNQAFKPGPWEALCITFVPGFRALSAETRVSGGLLLQAVVNPSPALTQHQRQHHPGRVSLFPPHNADFPREELSSSSRKGRGKRRAD